MWTSGHVDGVGVGDGGEGGRDVAVLIVTFVILVSAVESVVTALILIAVLDHCRCKVMFGLLLAFLALLGVVLERKALRSEEDVSTLDEFPAVPEQHLPRLLVV